MAFILKRIFRTMIIKQIRNIMRSIIPRKILKTSTPGSTPQRLQKNIHKDYKKANKEQTTCNRMLL